MVRLLAFLWLLVYAKAAADSGGNEEAEDEAALLQVSLLQRDLRLGRPLVGEAPNNVLAAMEAKPASKVPQYTVDLDLPPEDRWKGFYKKYCRYLLDTFPPESPTPEETKRREAFNSNVSVSMKGEEEYMAEYRGIVDACNDSRVSFTSLLWNEFGYEHGMTIGCTGILAATANGTVFHGRNLDMGDAESLMHMLLDVTYTRGGKPIAITTAFPFMVGVHTAMRLDGYSIAQNTRQGADNMAENLQAAREGAKPFALFMRRLVEEVPDWRAAVQRTAETYLIAPQYFTLAGTGPHEGALVTRDRKGNQEPYGNVLMLNPRLGRWYLVQTNDDINHPPSDPRRDAALRRLQKMQPQDVNEESLMRIMRIEPVLNQETIFTWVVEPLHNTRKMLLGDERVA